MNDPRLFYESWGDALKDDVAAIGGSKAVGPMFWPEKSVHAAANTLNDRLNPDRRDRLSDEQERLIIRKAREARGFSAALFFLCDEAGFDRPKSKLPGDELAELQRQFIEHVQIQARIAQRIEGLTRAPLAERPREAR